MQCFLSTGSRTCHLRWYTRYVTINAFFARMPAAVCLLWKCRIVISFPCCCSLIFLSLFTSVLSIFSQLCSSEEIEKKLTAYRKGCKIWNMLIFCQVGKICVIICISGLFWSVHAAFLCAREGAGCKLALLYSPGRSGSSLPFEE